MNVSSPYFSIVMPTRNRAHLLRYALQSALDQTFDDYEIVVSDNWSSDDTAQVVQQVGGARVRYVRTDRVLPMHDSWEFALSQARGEWITYLCDDDALYPEALQRIADSITTHQPQLVSWLTASYFIDLPSAQYPERRRQLLMPRATGRTFTVPSRPDLVGLFAMSSTDDHRLPKMLNSCCHRRLTEKVKQQLGRFFLPPCPDYTCCVAMLAKTERYTFIDAPLALIGMGAHSFGVAPSYGKPTVHLDFVEDFGGDEILKHVPLSFLTNTNSIVESLLRVREAMAAELCWLEPDWSKYFADCYRDILSLARYDVDVSEMRNEYFAVLARRPPLFRTRVRALLFAPRIRFLFQKGLVRQAINRWGILRLADPFIGTRRRAVLGGRRGFANILEAVQYVSQGGGGHSARLGHDAG
jgi:glycosyltransferase involved in cell wall biosynthesis